MKSRLIIHCGARRFVEGDRHLPGRSEALQETLKETYPILIKSGSRAAVIHAVRMLEDNPLFNAGTGSKIQRDREIRMTASLMSSSDNKFSGVINIQYVQNPIEVADLLAREEHTVLGGEGATQYAQQHGFAYHDPMTESRLQDYLKKLKGGSGTVGAVALDEKGIISAATSTGGTGYELPGRISDSATVAGNYASSFAGVSMTGRGEEIVNQSAASKIVTRVQDGTPLEESVQKLIEESDSFHYRLGLISLDAQGNMVVGCTKNTAILYATWDGKKIETFLNT